MNKCVLDRDPRRKPDPRHCERKALSERDSCVSILNMRTEAMHGSISADCAVGAKYYLADPDRDWEGVCNACERTYSNHDPNNVLDRDLERDSFSCEHSH